MHLLLAAGEESSAAMLQTVAAAISLGVILIVVARRIGVPAIVLLLAGGVLAGPAVLGQHALVKPDSLGDGLGVIVHLAVGLILFEGGMTLDLSGYRTAPRMIKRLLSTGVLVTWGGAAALCWQFGGLELKYAVLAGSMVIVTGPTVIAPLLKRIGVNEKVHSILHWEGVLIDPIGVFIAVLCFEVVVSGVTGSEAAMGLLLRVVSGVGLGVAGGYGLAVVSRTKLIPEDMTNVFALATAVAVFELAEIVRPEAGLLSVTIAGFVFGAAGTHRVKQVREFKAELTDLLIGTLFILLSARLSFDQFVEFGLAGAACVLGVMFVVRPLAIMICSRGLDLSRSERLFLAWVAPRGIVAASLASLFALSITRTGDPDAARFVETFVYSVIITTIVVQGLTAGPLARMLGVKRQRPTGWLIVGAHHFGMRIAEFLEAGGIRATLVDTNRRAIREAEQRGLTAIAADARAEDLAARPELHGVGNLLALTDNEDLNIRVCQTWREVLDPDRCFRCDPAGRGDEHAAGEAPDAGEIVWTRLPRPSLLAGELQRGQASLIGSEQPQDAIASVATPVATLHGDELVFAGPETIEDRGATSADDTEPKPMRVLYLQRTVEHLLWSLRPELVIDVEPGDLRSLFTQIVDAMVRVVPGLSREETIRELLDRESAFPTVLGHGVALPHAYTSSIDGRLCAIARVSGGGMRFGESDGEPVRLVFALISPVGDPEGHLASLAEIARLVVDEDVREGLLAARGPLEVIGIVGDGAKRA